MKSLVMMGQMGEQPSRLDPRWPGTNIPAAQPLPAGATVDTLVVEKPRWDPAQAIETIATISKAEKQLSTVGVIKPTGINFQTLAAYIGTGAGVGTAIAPGIGTLVGAVVGLSAYIIQWAANRPWSTNKTYPNAPAHVRMWAAAFLDQEYLDFAVANNANSWGTEKEMAMGQLIFWLERWGVVITLGAGKFYSGKPDALYIGYAGGESAVAEMYAQMMVDYHGTKQARITMGLDGTAAAYNVTMVYKATVKLPHATVTPGYEGGDTQTSAGSSGLVVLGLAAGTALLLANSKQ